MKLSRKLVPAIAMLLVSAVMLSTASFAWFSMNTTVDVKNMKVQASAMGSLVITTDKSVLDANYAGIVADFDTTNASKLIDATHNTTIGTTTGLATVADANRAQVDATTGEYTPTNLVEAVNVGTTKLYYYDYVVYLAAKTADIEAGKNSEDKQLKNQLNASVTYKDSSVADSFYHDAIAIDFYVMPAGSDANPTVSNFVTTIHLDDDTAGANATSVALFEDTIPAADSTDGFVKVVMRVYIDGAYEKDGNVVANNATWNATAVSFNVNFALTTTLANP
ncbi:MAG: hypothetical protein J6T24_00755 [Clostridia bacterium]|nr:hypothetical protein [Clostridia bacterium]